MRSLLALFALLFAIALAPSAHAYTPPPLVGHVVDAANVLSDSQRASLDTKLDRFRQERGFAIVVLTVPTLGGETINDVAYDAFNKWAVGEKKLDNGVLLVIAPNERRTRIETGKGVGGSLPDLLASDILRQKVHPLLAQGRTYEAIDAGTTAIEGALTAEGGGASQAERPPQAPSPLHLLLGGLALLVLIIAAIVSPTFRAMLWFALMTGFGRGGRGGGGGGGGYGGGGGQSGGGGASGDY